MGDWTEKKNDRVWQKKLNEEEKEGIVRVHALACFVMGEIFIPFRATHETR